MGVSAAHLWVADNVEQLDDVDAAFEILQHLDLALNLFLLDGLQCVEERGVWGERRRDSVKSAQC